MSLIWYIILHVPCVAEVLAGLVGALVCSVLQVNNALPSSQLFICELSLVLVSHLRSKDGSSPFRVDLGRSAEGEEALRYLDDVPLLPQVDGLEDIDLWHSVRLAGLLEPVDVLHQLELTSSGVDLGDTSGHHLVH